MGDRNNVIVRFSTGANDLPVDLAEGSTVGDLKEEVKRNKPELSDKYLRLIYNGRILQDDHTLRHYGLSGEEEDEQFIHCMASDITDRVHTDEESGMESGTIQVARGFDRLREAGFSDTEIGNIRRQFHEVHGTDETGEHARELEDTWIDGSVREEAGEAPGRSAMYQDLAGVIIGFFGGPLILPWYFSEKITNPRHRIRIIAGIFMNLSFGIIRWLYS